VSFFDPVASPLPSFDRVQRPGPWEEGLGKTVFNDVVLGHGPDGVLMLRNLIAFPNVMTLSVVALFRHPLVQGPGTGGHNCPMFVRRIGDESVGTGIVMFGLRFSDGTRYRNLDAKGSSEHLGNLRGGGGGFTGYHEFWAPLPTPGELEVWVAWPAAQIQESQTLLDATLICDTAAALQPSWP
jgi:hypothetical protein